MTTTVMSDVIDDAADDVADHREPDDRPAPRARPKTAAVLAVAVLVPLLLFGVRALRAPVGFDGAMNLQVAERLAAGDGYTRHYGDVDQFPHEVQTNGPFLTVAALGIAALGHGQLGYDFANLAFVAGFALAVALLLRDHRRLQVVGPALVLVGAPSIASYALGGMGEVPTTFFLFLAVLAIAAALRSLEHAPRWVFGASVAFGAALVTKTFAIGAAGAMALGVAAVLVATPTARRRGRIALATAGVVVVPAMWELYKLVSLGSFGAYRAWWSVERANTSAQSGLEDTDAGLYGTFDDHLRELSRQVHFPSGLLLIVLFLPVAWVAARVVAQWRREGLGHTARDPHMVVLLMLAGLAASYILWWLFVLPESKLWVRRMLPGLFALHVLYLFMVPWLVGAVRTAWRGRRPTLGAAAALGVAAVVLVVLPYSWDRIDGGTRSLVDGQQAWLQADRDAAAHIRAHDDQRYYGDDWWSAPTVSLMARTDFRDLSLTDPCSLDPARDRVVWDFDARAVTRSGPSTHGGTLTFTQVAAFDGYVWIYAVGPSPGTCG